MVGAAPLGAPSSFEVSTLPALALPVSFTMAVAVVDTVPFMTVTVKAPAAMGEMVPGEVTAATPEGLTFQAAQVVTSMVEPSAKVPLAVNVTGPGACGYVTVTI